MNAYAYDISISCAFDALFEFYLFTGKERDGESGNDYFGARYYGSSMGRFLSPDPIWIKGDRILDPQRLNLYAYTMNNPLRFTDPSGMDVNLGNCPGSMTIKTCEGAILYGLLKNDRGHVHFVEGNDRNGYKKGEVGVLVDADYKSKSLNFTTLQTLANDHSALAKVDILDPNDRQVARSSASRRTARAVPRSSQSHRDERALS